MGLKPPPSFRRPPPPAPMQFGITVKEATRALAAMSGPITPELHFGLSREEIDRYLSVGYKRRRSCGDHPLVAWVKVFAALHEYQLQRCIGRTESGEPVPVSSSEHADVERMESVLFHFAAINIGAMPKRHWYDALKEALRMSQRERIAFLKREGFLA